MYVDPLDLVDPPGGMEMMGVREVMDVLVLLAQLVIYIPSSLDILI